MTPATIEDFAAKSLAAPATLVTDGLGCFTAVRGLGILHEQHVTGGGVASVKIPRSWPSTRPWATSRPPWPALTTPSASTSTRIAISGKVLYLFNRRFNLRSILERLAQPPVRPRRARFARFVRLNFIADQVAL